MLELKLGHMTTKELADWANRSELYIQKNKKQWCDNNLSIYADYELCRGGVKITAIKNPVFLSSGLQEVRDKYRKYWGYGDLSIDTNTQCWVKLSADMVNKLQYETGRNYVSKCRREEYGVARKCNKYDGSKGYCHYIFCKSINGKPVLFTEEELKIKSDLSKQYLKSDEQDEMEKQALTADYKRGEISQEEYAESIANLISNDKGWVTFQEKLNEALGCETDFFIEVIDDAIKHQEFEF